MTTNQPDWAEKRVEKLLPHYDAYHGVIAGCTCPCTYRPAVAQALREARDEGSRNEADKVRRWLNNLLAPVPYGTYTLEDYAKLIVAAERRGYERALESIAVQFETNGYVDACADDSARGRLSQSEWNRAAASIRALKAKEPNK